MLNGGIDFLEKEIVNTHPESRDSSIKFSGDPFTSAGPSSQEPLPPESDSLPAASLPPMPKLWIGYLLAFVTFVGEIIAVSRHPEVFNAKEIKFDIPPLEIFLPAFVTRVYWFVCIYRYHKILAAVPRYAHPISAGRAVGFHFIPFFNVFWIFHWPAAMAEFVNARLRAPVMRGWALGIGILGAFLCQIFLDAGFGAALLFLVTSNLERFLKRALSVPEQAPQV